MRSRPRAFVVGLSAVVVAAALSGCGPNIPAPGTQPPSDGSVSPSASPSGTGAVIWSDYEAGCDD